MQIILKKKNKEKLGKINNDLVKKLYCKNEKKIEGYMSKLEEKIISLKKQWKR